jgi:hypothetical protein
MRRKTEFQKELQDLLIKYEIDKYCALHGYMLSEHLVRWIEEYVRQTNVAKDWPIADDRQPNRHIIGNPNGHFQPHRRSASEDLSG